MIIIIQPLKKDKYSGEVIDQQVSLSNEGYDGFDHVLLTIDDGVTVELPLSDLFTAVESFHNHYLRDVKKQLQLSAGS